MSEPMKMDPIAMQIGKITVVTQSQHAESGAALIRVTRPGESDSFSKINVDGTRDVAFKGDKNPRQGGEQRALDVMWSLLTEQSKHLRAIEPEDEKARQRADANGEDAKWEIDGRRDPRRSADPDRTFDMQVTTLPIHEFWIASSGTTVPITVDRVRECVQMAIDKKTRDTASGYQRKAILVVDGRDVGTVLWPHPTSALDGITVSGEWAGVYFVGPTAILSATLKPIPEPGECAQGCAQDPG